MLCVLIHAHTYTGVSVYEARLNMGKKLAEKIIKLYGPDHGIDAVIPVPDTARTSALECAETLGVPYREGFIKNRYIGRTFIMPGQTARREGVYRPSVSIAGRGAPPPPRTRKPSARERTTRARA